MNDSAPAHNHEAATNNGAPRRNREAAAGDSAPRHARDVIRDVHGALVQEGLRDQVTVVASGGIAVPEHMAKAILCDADLVAADLPFVAALECRLCRECEADHACPVDMDHVDPAYGIQRVVNLAAAWYHQLIEVLGAMGIREVRRMRGETGRALFFEDLERECPACKKVVEPTVADALPKSTIGHRTVA